MGRKTCPSPGAQLRAGPTPRGPSMLAHLLRLRLGIIASVRTERRDAARVRHSGNNLHVYKSVRYAALPAPFYVVRRVGRVRRVAVVVAAGVLVAQIRVDAGHILQAIQSGQSRVRRRVQRAAW